MPSTSPTHDQQNIHLHKISTERALCLLLVVIKMLYCYKYYLHDKRHSNIIEENPQLLHVGSFWIGTEVTC